MSIAIEQLQADAAARQRALDVASFIVEAPAGAGKTELLTQRTLRLLAIVDQPEEVLALTFTNKAAAEMRDRILGSLEQARRGDAVEAPHKATTRQWASAVLARDGERGWGLLEHPGRLRITTLDALCASLARQMPLLSRFGAQPQVAEDAAAHYATAARRTLDMLENGDAEAEVVAAALALLDNNAGRLENLLVAMLGRRDQWLQHAQRLNGEALRAEVEAGFAALFGGELETLAAACHGRLQQMLMAPVRFAAANQPASLGLLADWQAPLGADLADLPRWQALAGLLLTSSGTWRRRLDKNCGFPADKAAKEFKEAMSQALAELAGVGGLEAAFARVGDLPVAQFDAAEWATVEACSRLLRLAAGQLWLVFQEAGEVDFIEIAARAGLALGDDEAPTDLAQALDYRIRHLLVDEFQDTSPGQVALLARLMRGWEAGDGRTLFVVGDPMQSIYRFRKADVGLFLNVRRHGIGDLHLEHLRLYRNNRSCPAVVDWVNAAFPAIFPAADDPGGGAVRYSPSAATRAADATAGVVIHPLLVAPGGDAAVGEAAWVLELIRGSLRERPDERVAVLVRARSHLAELIATIRRVAPELRFQAVDMESLADRQAIQDLLSLYAALCHRADRVNWLAVLRAPWCGLSLADLHALAADDHRATIWQLLRDDARLERLSDDGRQRALRLRAVFAEAFAERGRRHPRRWLEGVWLLLGGARCLREAAELADVESFFQLLDRLVAAGQATPEVLAGETGKLFAPADPGGAQVQMMTIHKAKGLEFETVIVPGLQRETGGHDGSLLLWDEVAGPDGREYLLVAPMKAPGQGSGATLYDYLRRLESERAAHEDERLLYVAATRAIRRLHLVGSAVLDPDKPAGVKPPPAGALLRLLWPGLAEPLFAAAAGELAESAAAAASPLLGHPYAPLLRLESNEAPPELSDKPAAPRANPRGEESLPEPAVAEEALIGTLVHRYLELIARQGLAAWPVTRLTALAAQAERWLRARGVDEARLAMAVASVVAALRNTLASPLGQWLLAAHGSAASEEAWLSVEAAGVSGHVIDRCFIADGCRWIVDYKTVLAAGVDLLERSETHRPQLLRYASLYIEEGVPLRLAVWYPLQGELVELLGGDVGARGKGSRKLSKGVDGLD